MDRWEVTQGLEEAQGLRPWRLFQGRSGRAAEDIFEHNRFRVGTSPPRAIWFSEDFEFAAAFARDFAGHGGLVVEVFHDSLYGLERYGDHWVVRVPSKSK